MFILTVGKPFDREKFLKQFGQTTSARAATARFVVDEEESLAVRFLDDRTLAFGTVPAIQLHGG